MCPIGITEPKEPALILDFQDPELRDAEAFAGRIFPKNPLPFKIMEK
ncbi:MAG: hypothetical protein CM15mP126_3720 [Gammaproteobacteria bacterium]|nr:MAG: hypothetical protein CM15mP126_3720 [Gammaproteobacteria bacterium]